MNVPIQTKALKRERTRLACRVRRPAEHLRHTIIPPANTLAAIPPFFPKRVPSTGSAKPKTLEAIPPLLGGGFEPFGKRVQGIRRSRRPAGPSERAGASPRRGEGERCPQAIPQPSKNPKGIPPQSPGLRGTSYPGYAFPTNFNRNAVAASLCSRSKPEQPSRSAKPKRWNPFPLSPGERAGVRASVNPFSP